MTPKKTTESESVKKPAKTAAPKPEKVSVKAQVKAAEKAPNKSVVKSFDAPSKKKAASSSPEKPEPKSPSQPKISPPKPSKTRAEVVTKSSTKPVMNKKLKEPTPTENPASSKPKTSQKTAQTEIKSTAKPKKEVAEKALKGSPKSELKETAKALKADATVPETKAKLEKKTKVAPKEVSSKEPRQNESATAGDAVEPVSEDAKPVRKMPRLKLIPTLISKDGLKKSLPKKAVEPEVKDGQNGKKSKSEMLAKILMMRAAQTKKNSQKAAKAVVNAELPTVRVPQSVMKAAERLNTPKTPLEFEPKEKDKDKDKSEAAKKKKNRKRKPPYSKTEIKELRGILESERKRLVKDLDLINDMASSTEESMSRTFSSHQADAAQDSSSLETTFVTRRYGEERLHQIVVALERIEEGSYGLCEMCVDEKCNLCESCPFIPISRLRAKPFAKFCVQLRAQFEKSNRQK